MDSLLFYRGKDIEPIEWEDWIASKKEALQPLVINWREEVIALGDEVQLIFHDGLLTACFMESPFLYINAYKEHVNIGFYHAVDLPDPHGILQGTGKRMRHIKLVPGGDVKDAWVRALVTASYKDIRKRLE